MRARRGYLLAEALCALALAALLVTSAVGALRGARRATEAAESRARGERTGREVLRIVAALARDADSILVLGDTALELSIPIAVAVVCARDGDALLLPPTVVASGRPFTQRAQPIEAGDEVRVFVRDSSLAVAQWVQDVVDSVTEGSAATSCGVESGFVDIADMAVARMRLVLGALDSAVGPGAPLRVVRRGRLALYSSGGGEWMLGFRRCGAGTCGVVQPVAGPLRSPVAGGFQVRSGGGDGGLAVSVRVPGIDAPFESALRDIDARP